MSKRLFILYYMPFHCSNQHGHTFLLLKGINHQTTARISWLQLAHVIKISIFKIQLLLQTDPESESGKQIFPNLFKNIQNNQKQHQNPRKSLFVSLSTTMFSWKMKWLVFHISKMFLLKKRPIYTNKQVGLGLFSFKKSPLPCKAAIEKLFCSRHPTASYFSLIFPDDVNLT